MATETIIYKETFGPRGEGRAAMPPSPARCIGSALEKFNENNPDATIDDVSLDMNRGNYSDAVVEIRARQTIQ